MKNTVSSIFLSTAITYMYSYINRRSVSMCKDFSLLLLLSLLVCRPPPPDAENGVENEEQLIWRGEFTMHGMARFSASAYAVSGPVDYLDEV